MAKGEHPRLEYPIGEVPFLVGELVEVTVDVSLIVTGIKRVKSGRAFKDQVNYTLRDERRRLLRRAPHPADFDALRRSFDSNGQPQPILNQTEIADAAEESAYTGSTGAALVGEPEAVDRQSQELLTRESLEAKWDRKREQIDELEEVIERLEASEDFKGERSKLSFHRNLSRQLMAELEREERQAKAA